MTAGNDWLEQARRLVAGVGQSLAAGAADQHAGEGHSADQQGGEGHGGDCRWCPLCQAVAVLRGERPEVTTALADALSAAAAALRTLAADPPPDRPAQEAEERPSTVVQHIEIA